MQDSRFQRFEVSHPMHCSPERPLHFTETKTATPNRTKSLGTAHSMHGLQKRGRVKFVCVVGNFFAIQAGIESARDFQGFSSLPSTPYSNRRVFRNGLHPVCLFFSLDILFVKIYLMRKSQERANMHLDLPYYPYRLLYSSIA